MKIICYSPYSSVWFYTFPEAVLASELQKRGHKVLFITSGKEFPDMSSRINENIIRKKLGLGGYGISNVLNNEDRKEIAKYVKDLTPRNFENLKIDGIEVGKMALYETLLMHKKMNTHFSKREWKECLEKIKDTLISFYACRKIISLEKPDRVLIYNTLYSINHVWEKYANNKKIPVYFLANGVNLSDMNDTLIIAKRNSLFLINTLKTIWTKTKTFPASQKELFYITNHFIELLSAQNTLVYSSPKSKKIFDLRRHFNISANQKILTATLSSYDELFAANYIDVWKIPKHLIFKTQVEWVKALINYVKKRKYLFLIVRIHPREFPNRRYPLKSQHAKILQKILQKLPDNVKVNLPTDKISLYDFANETDVFLNAWSTAGVEMSMLGIPVVAYSKDLLLYPDDLNYTAKNLKGYFNQIDVALRKGWSYEKIKMTFRWLVLYYCRTIIKYRNTGGQSQDLEEKVNLFTRFSNNIYNRLPPKTRSLISRLLFGLPGTGVGAKQTKDCDEYLAGNIDISRVEKMIKKSEDTLASAKETATDAVTSKEEDRFLRNEIKRIYHSLFGDIVDSSHIKKNCLQFNLKRIIESSGMQIPNE